MCAICGEWHHLNISCGDARDMVAGRAHFHGPDGCLGFADDGEPNCPQCKTAHPVTINCKMAVDWRAWRDARRAAVAVLETVWGPTVTAALALADEPAQVRHDEAFCALEQRLLRS